MNETKYTPTPWIVAYDRIYDANGDCVAKADRHKSNRLHPVERDENLDFIVKVVNSHDKLVQDRNALLLIAKTIVVKGLYNLALDDYRTTCAAIAAVEKDRQK